MKDAVTVLKLRVELVDQTANVLDGQSRICNWLYNQLLDKANDFRKQYGEHQDPSVGKVLYSKLGLRNLVPVIKKEHPFLKVVHSSPLKNVALRLTSSIQAHQKSRKGKRQGKTGWPRFRSWKTRWFSLFYDEPSKGFRIENGKLMLSLGMGEDSKQRSVTLILPEANLLKEKHIRNLRIVKQSGIYYAVFTVNRILPETKLISKIISLDPNHKNLVYGVNTENQAIEIEPPFWLKIYDKRIDELKSKRDKHKKKSKLVEIYDHKGVPIGKQRWQPSNRWNKLNTTLERVYAKRREQTKTFCYTVAHKLFREYDLVSIGDYTPRGGGITIPMRRAMNNRSLIGRFKEVLSWVAQKSGKTYMEYSEEGTTRTCCNCQYRLENGLSPNIRDWNCPNCNTHHIRDENSAKNGLIRVLRNLNKENEGQSSLVSGSDHRSLQGASNRLHYKENKDTFMPSNLLLASCKKRWAWSVRPSGVLVTSRGTNGDLFHELQEIKQNT